MTIDAAASHADSKCALSPAVRVGVGGEAVVEQHDQAGQAGVQVLADHQLADPRRGAPVHVPQLVADHVFPQRVERDLPCGTRSTRPSRERITPVGTAVRWCTVGYTQTLLTPP